AEMVGLVGRCEDAALLGDGDVGPPVRRYRRGVRIADTDADVQEVGAVRQPQVDLERQVAQPLPLPQAQHLPTVGGGDAGGVHGGAGQGGVAGGADVPLDAAGVPGAVQGEVGGLEDRVAVEEFTVRGLVDEGGDPAAEGGQDGGGQRVVLYHEGDEGAGRAPAVVAVTGGDGQQTVQGGVSDLPRHVARQALLVAVLDTVH